MIPLIYYLILGALLFGLGLAGIVIHRKNLIILLMCLELMFLGVNMNFIAFARYFNDLSGQVFVFFVLAIAAVEAAIGLAILMALYRHKHTVAVDRLNSLRG